MGAIPTRNAYSPGRRIISLAGLGATASTTAAGVVADAFGAPAAFLGLAIIGFASVALIWWMMPETRPRKPLIDSPALVAA